MNPAEEIPPEVEHRAYYRQPVWKRIFVIGAGPAVNICIAFAAAGRHLLGQRHRGAALARGVRQGRVAGRRRSCSPATSSSRSTEAPGGDKLRDQNASIAKQISTHKCETDGARLRATDARHAAGPPRRASCCTLRATPVYDARARSGRCSASPSAAPSTRRGRCARPRLSVDDDVGGHPRHRDDDRGDLRGREAQGDLRRGRLLRDDAPVDRGQHDPGAVPARRSSRCRWASSTCSRSCRSTAGTSSGRSPRRCAAGAIPFSVMERAGFVGLRARDGAVRDRPHATTSAG